MGNGNWIGGLIELKFGVIVISQIAVKLIAEAVQQIINNN